jgi:predicted ATPase
MESLVSASGILTKLKLTNFKCHKETSDIEVAPITLLVGPNSSGKTALLQPLLMLKQTLEPRAALVTPIILDGSYVNLGTFSDIMYDHDTQNSLEIELGIEIPLKPLSLPSATKKYLQERKLNKLGVVCSVRIDYSEKEKRMILSEATFSSEVFNFHYYPMKMVLEGEMFGRKLGTIKEPPSREQNLKSLMNILPILIRGSLSEDKETSLRRWQKYYFVRKATQSLLSTMENLVYIGPIREYPSRYYVSSGEKASDVGISGEEAISVLIQDRVLGGNLEKQLSNWLKRLGVADGLNIRQIDPYLFSLEILSPLTKTTVNITGAGFGVSQIIPAIIQGYLMPRNSTLILEQPEIHLHPKAQAILADLLIHLEKKGKRFIVETHSEHIILRLQRRVAERKIKRDKIKIYYFDTSEAGVTIRPIKIDSKGQLLDFPPGFMEEGLEEAYGIALASSSKE